MTPKSKAMQSKAQGDENQVAYSELLCLHIFLGYWMKSFWAPAVPEAFQWGRKSNPEEDRSLTPPICSFPLALKDTQVSLMLTRPLWHSITYLLQLPPSSFSTARLPFSEPGKSVALAPSLSICSSAVPTWILPLSFHSNNFFLSSLVTSRLLNSKTTFQPSLAWLLIGMTSHSSFWKHPLPSASTTQHSFHFPNTSGCSFHVLSLSGSLGLSQDLYICSSLSLWTISSTFTASSAISILTTPKVSLPPSFRLICWLPTRHLHWTSCKDL